MSWRWFLRVWWTSEDCWVYATVISKVMTECRDECTKDSGSFTLLARIQTQWPKPPILSLRGFLAFFCDQIFFCFVSLFALPGAFVCLVQLEKFPSLPNALKHSKCSSLPNFDPPSVYAQANTLFGHLEWLQTVFATTLHVYLARGHSQHGTGPLSINLRPFPQH